MAERDRRTEEREERRERRIQEQKVRQGKERRETRFLRLRERPRPKKPPAQAQTGKSYGERVIDATVGAGDTDLVPDDPLSQTIREQAGPLYYTPPDQPPEGTVDPIDRLVTGFTGRLWRRAEEIRSSTEPLSYEEQRYRRVKWDIPDMSLAMKRAELGALNLGIGFVEGFTFPVRPSAWGRTAEGLVGLATDKERRREAVQFALDRPEAVGLQLLGGVFGGYAAGKIIGKIQGEYIRRKYLTDLPDEAFLVPDEARSAFPEAVDVERTTFYDYMKFKGEYSVIDDVDLYRGPLTYDKGLKGFRRTGHDVVPDQWVPDYAQTRRIYEPVRTKFIETVESFRSPVRFNLRSSFTPRSLTGLGLIGLSGIHGRPIDVKSDTVEKQVDKQLDRVGLGQRQRGREREMFATEQRREILPDLEPFIRPRPMPTLPDFVEPPREIQRQRRRQRFTFTPDLRLEPKQRQQFKQAMAIPQIQRFSYREPNLDPTSRRRRKKKGRRGDLDLFTYGEIRAYPLKSVEKIMKEMGI